MKIHTLKPVYQDIFVSFTVHFRLSGRQRQPSLSRSTASALGSRKERSVGVCIVATKTLEGRLDFTSSGILPSLRVIAKIIDDNVHDLLTNDFFWEANVVRACKRVDSSDDKGRTSCFCRSLFSLGAKSIELVTVQKSLRERRGRPN
jgi:hypothetical protein